MHIAERLAERRNAPTAMVCTWEAGVTKVTVVNKGSLVQMVTEELLRLDEGFLKQWKVLEKNPDYRAVWMVRDGWFQWPIVLLWRSSLALFYVWLGLRYVGRALLGQDGRNII